MFKILKETRKKYGVTCRQMSLLLGHKTRGAYHKKELGHVPFTLEEARKIADYFQKDINEIFFEKEYINK